MDTCDKFLFVALFSFHLFEKRRRVETAEMDMYVGNNYVACVHYKPLGD